MDEKDSFFKLLHRALLTYPKEAETTESQSESEKVAKKTRPSKTEDVSR